MAMLNRDRLQKILEEILGSKEVYFQPPENRKMNYPAIVYSLNSIDNDFADNSVYIQACSYTITVIDKDPDSEIMKKVSKLPMCIYNRHFPAFNLHHYVFTLYY